MTRLQRKRRNKRLAEIAGWTVITVAGLFFVAMGAAAAILGAM